MLCARLHVWQRRLGWLGIRCFSVLFALEMAFQGVTINHIFGANDVDAASAYVFSASVFLFMGVLPSNKNRRRVIGVLKRLTLSECDLEGAQHIAPLPRLRERADRRCSHATCSLRFAPCECWHTRS